MLLVEGGTRLSTAIRYLTQSTWSHAALSVGDAPGLRAADGTPLTVLEADVVDGVRAVGLAAFGGHHLRSCRPVGLQPSEIAAMVDHAVGRLGHRSAASSRLARSFTGACRPAPRRWR